MRQVIQEIKRIKSMMGLIFEDTEDKCLCPDGITKKRECCEECECLDGTKSMDCCGELSKMEILPASNLNLGYDLPDTLSSLPKQKYEVNLDGVPQDLIDSMSDYGINIPLEQAHFLAQCKMESVGFTKTTEMASGNAYEGRCKGLGNCSPGDGVKYKGRGYMQLTGKANYEEYNKWLKEKYGTTDDVVKNPELVATKYAGDVSAWFWAVAGPKYNKNFPHRSLQGTSDKVIDKIGEWVNGASPPNGYKERRQAFKDILIDNSGIYASNK